MNDYADTGTLYLTSTGRLERRLCHRFRVRMLKDSLEGWEAPSIMTLNAWLHRVWTESWPMKMAAPELLRLKIWKAAVIANPPPGPIGTDMRLLRLLDETLAVLIGHGLNPQAGITSTPLVEWRRQICGSFMTALDEEGYFHPANLPALVNKLITSGIVRLPSRVELAGFQSPSPIEEYLFETMKRFSSVKRSVNCNGKAEKVEAIALPSLGQEVAYMAERLVEDAQILPLSRIGVIVPGLESCHEKIRCTLEEILGAGKDGQEQYFNITLGRSVIESPLVRAALLPLRFLSEGQNRELFLSLILSPYYECWGHDRHVIARLDRHWRVDSVENGFELFVQTALKKSADYRHMLMAGKENEINLFFQMDFESKHSGGWWTENFKTFLTSLGFPVLSDEKDRIAARHLFEILDDISVHLDNVLLDGPQFLSWVTDMASHRATHASASEEAGIQIMGVIESRGLDFDKLYVVNIDDRTLPQPVRPLPFLDRNERKSVQGGTVESQYEFAKRTFNNIMGASPDITLMRAEYEDNTPLNPSPFWPTGEKNKYIDLWTEPGNAWTRAPWLRCAHEGLRGRNINDETKCAKNIMDQENEGKVHEERLNVPDILPSSLSVSQVETAINCPFAFLAKELLSLDRLEKPQPAVSPLKRGSTIHRIVARFTRKIRESGTKLGRERERALSALNESADREMKRCINDPRWQVEKRRLLDPGEENVPGILRTWFEEEILRSENGWICLGEEVPFDKLNEDGWPFSLRGRIDRIDFHERLGIICWDYKTGNAPGKLDILIRHKSPQLPLYLLAVAKKVIPNIFPSSAEAGPISAGYIELKSPRDFRINEISGIDGSLDDWNFIVYRSGRELAEGRFKALPYPFSNVDRRADVCMSCPYRYLCARGLQADLTNLNGSANEEID